MRKISTATAGISDQELMQRVQGGDVLAFEQLYDRYQDRVWRVASLVCQESNRAEAAVEEAFIALWRDRASYRPERTPAQAWTIRTVYCCAIAQQPQPETALPTNTQAEAGGSRGTIRAADTPASDGLLQRLSSPQREIIALAFYGGLSYVQIAETLRIPPRAVKQHMRLGLHEVRGFIDTTRVSDEPGR